MAEDPMTDRAGAGRERAAEDRVPVLSHLSGGHRGRTQRLDGALLRLGTAAADVRLAPDAAGVVGPRHARLARRGDAWFLDAEPGWAVWLNGRRVDSSPLSSGDLIEIGEGGPALRFRLYPRGAEHKSMGEAFADCRECARRAGGGRIGRAAGLAAAAPRELATQTSPTFRLAVVGLLVLLVTATGWLTLRTERLEDRLAGESEQLAAFTAWAERAERGGRDLRHEIDEALSRAGSRLEALEARSSGTAAVVAAATRTVVFLQGGYGFEDPASGRLLRYAGFGLDGSPLLDGAGRPIVTLEGEGPVVESLYTGTGFVATAGGLLVTNRHVALPWEYDDAARSLIGQGLRPVMRRFVGYLPGEAEAFPVALVRASDGADLAVLRCTIEGGTLPPLELAGSEARPGDPVIVLGYPTGIRAVVARADPAFLERLRQGPEASFWSVASDLARAGYLAPLASRGIVGQRTAAAVVYDAATFQGGSGGPVIDLEGRVVAVNAAILPEFGGSNLGVPVSAVAELLAAVRGAAAAGDQPPSG